MAIYRQGMWMRGLKGEMSSDVTYHRRSSKLVGSSRACRTRKILDFSKWLRDTLRVLDNTELVVWLCKEPDRGAQLSELFPATDEVLLTY